MFDSARFVLIDHSVAGEGGHYLEYARHVLAAASEAGYRPVLVTNQAFRPTGAEPFEIYALYERDIWGRKFARPWRRRRLPPALERVVRPAFGLVVLLRYSRLGLLVQLARNPRLAVRRVPDASSILLIGVALLPVLYARAIAQGVRNFLIAVLGPILRSYVGVVLAASLRLALSFLYPVIAPWRHRSLLVRAFVHQRRVSAFARDTERLLRRLWPDPSDVLFIPTLSEADLAGLTRCFRREPLAAVPSWHLLFRRDIYSGRESRYGLSSDETERTRRSLLRESLYSLVADFPRHRVRLYTDTDRLTDQYNRLNTFEFNTVPIPVNTSFRPESRRRLSPPIVTFLGDARSEKGYHVLPALVDALQQELASGDLRFVLQSNFAFGEPESDPAAVVARNQLRRYPATQVRLVERPLNSIEYADLLLSSSVVLIPYDAERYYARSSGVLVEALSAGAPVVVPAGSWMSDVIQPETTRYHEELATAGISVRRIPTRWRAHSGAVLDTAHGFVFGAGTAGITTRFPVARGNVHMLVRVSFASHVPSGSYVRLWSRWADRANLTLHTESRVIGGTGDQRASALFRIPGGTDSAQLAVSNAWDPTLIALESVHVDVIDGEVDGVEALGRTYEQPSELPAVLRELLASYSGYERRATAFSASWVHRHSPRALVSKISVSQRTSPVVIEAAASRVRS